MHSRYERKLADTAAGGQEVLIHLQARRFFCGSVACEKVTFAEQVPDMTVRCPRLWHARWRLGNRAVAAQRAIQPADEAGRDAPLFPWRRHSPR